MSLEANNDNAVLHLEEYPPGTIPLERLIDQNHGEIILHPRPTHDPNDPLNWPVWYKMLNFALVSFYTLMVFVNLDIGTVIWGNLIVDLGFSYKIETYAFGVNTAGLAVGCILLVPLALKFGRRPIYLVSLAVDLATAIWQAKMQTPGDLWGSNMLSGIAGAISETIAQMTIADLFFVHQRGSANGFYIVMVNVGAFLAPVAAGYSADSQGWRWIWWWTTILFAVCLVLFIFLYEETKYIPQHHGTSSVAVEDVKDSVDHIERRTSTHKHTINAGMAREEIQLSSIPRKTYWQRLSFFTTSPGGWSMFLRHSWQPFYIVATFPAVTYTALTWGSLLAWFSVVVSTYSVYFTYPPYNFSASGVGLMNLPPFIGGIFGSLYGGLLSDRLIIRLSRRNGGIYEPEMRLWLALPAILILPGTILWYGLSLANGLHWIVPAVGLGVFGFAFGTLGDISLTYTMDCYKQIIGDAFIAVTFVRNAFATIVAMCLTQWIAGVTLVGLFAMCAALSFVFSAVTIPMLIWGKRMRIWTAKRLKVMAERQFGVRE